MGTSNASTNGTKHRRVERVWKNAGTARPSLPPPNQRPPGRRGVELVSSEAREGHSQEDPPSSRVRGRRLCPACCRTRSIVLVRVVVKGWAMQCPMTASALLGESKYRRPPGHLPPPQSQPIDPGEHARHDRGVQRQIQNHRQPATPPYPRPQTKRPETDEAVAPPPCTIASIASGVEPTPPAQPPPTTPVSIQLHPFYPRARCNPGSRSITLENQI